jgi:hypothetical protein
MANVSLLLGSGFSVPADYPTATKINERMRRIDATEICVHTSGKASFLKDEKYPNADQMRVEERAFVQDFLEFYNKRVLTPGEMFDYETFYDYYNAAYRDGAYPDDLATFLNDFLQNKVEVVTDGNDLLMKFNDTFSQLLAGLLTKPIDRAHLCKPYHPSHSAFLLLLEELGKVHTVHIHTLNHDLYMEHFNQSDAIQGELDDGFEELGSPFYGQKYEQFATYMIRLSRFTNTYGKRFRLYKLHGSIDHFWSNYNDGSFLIKIPWGIDAHEIHREFKRDEKLWYEHNPSDVVPEFLSGTTQKIARYERGPYYPRVLEHFVRNLEASNTLIVIGYGFRDERINQYLEKLFLDNPRKSMIVVDVVLPKNPLMNRENVHFINGGVSGMDIRQVLARIIP